jgi:eukaryotic-like serine/threonine-protein kinase
MTDLQSRLQTALGDAYRLERELGGGGMSRVFVARETRLGRQVVIKVLPPEMAAGVNVERFEREIQLAARLQHPHVVALLTAGADGDLLYYVMPLIKGESLRAKLAREGELPIGEAARILRDVADALAYAHSEGVVHRDIKPDNVLLSGHHALVADFGVAKAVTASSGEASLTSLGVALGTPAYMAPEQAAAETHVDHRADIYAFGALAYEVVTGRPPFNLPTAQAILAAHVTQSPEPVTAHRAAVPPAMAELIMRCLAKKPADRWQKADDLRAQMEAMVTPTGGMTPTATQPVQAVDHEAAARRAHPLRVAALFGLASVGVLAIVYALVVLIGLPDWVTWGAGALLVAGLPIMLWTSRHEHRRAEARRTGVQVTTPVGLPRYFTFRKALLGGGIAFVGLALAAAGYMAMRSLGIGPVGTLVASGVLAEGEQIVLADFVDQTGDPSLARTVTEALRVDLTQSSALTVMSPSAVRDALQRMERNPDGPMTVEIAREVANRGGLKAVLTGEVSTVGGGYVLSAQLVSAETGDVLTAQRATAADSTRLIEAMDKLSAGLRERVGESLRSIRAREPLLWATTSSLPALRRYSEANRAIEDGDNRRGIELLREAVTLDSTFAEAWRKLAIELGNSNINRREMLQAMTNAYRWRDRLPEATRYFVEAGYHNVVSEDPESAIRAYRAALDANPASGGARNNLAVAYFELREPEQARQAIAEAMAIDSTYPLYHFNTIGALLQLGRLDSAAIALERFRRIAPGHYLTRIGGMWLGFQQRDWTEVERLLADVSGGTPADPVYLLRAKAFAAAAQGKLARADQVLAEAEARATAAGLRGLALTVGLQRADLVAASPRDPASGRQAVSAALGRTPLASIDTLDRPYGLLAGLQAQVGDAAAARATLAQLEREITGPLFSPRVRASRDSALGYLALAERNGAQAVRYWSALSSTGWCEVCGLPELASAWELAGNLDSAIAVGERYLAVTGAWREASDFRNLGPTMFRLGEWYEARGDRARAVEYYGQFTELWKDADAGLQPRVREARDRIARLSLR